MIKDLKLNQDDLLDLISQNCSRNSQDVPLLVEVLSSITDHWYTLSTEQITEVESLSKNLAETYEELSFMYQLNNAMNISVTPEQYFRNLADDLCELLMIKAMRIILFPSVLTSNKTENTVISSGPLPQDVEEVIRTFDFKLLAQAGSQVHKIPDTCNIQTDQEHHLKQTLTVPIRKGDQQFGLVMAMSFGSERNFNNIDLTRLASVADSAAVFSENIRLYSSMRDLFLGSLRALTSSIDAKDPYTCGHSERVAILGKKLAEQMDMSQTQIDQVYLCGLLHDIGKIGVPEATLRKPGKLTDEEFESIKSHPAIGAQIIAGIKAWTS